MHGEVRWALVVVGHYKVFGFKRLEASEGLLGRRLMWSACQLKSPNGIAVLGWEHCGDKGRSRDDCLDLRHEEMKAWMRLVEMTRVKSGQTLNWFGRLGQPDFLMDWIQVWEKERSWKSFLCFWPVQLSNVQPSFSGFQESIFLFPLLCFWLCCLFHMIFSCFCLIIITLTSAVSSGFSLFLCSRPHSLSWPQLYLECTQIPISIANLSLGLWCCISSSLFSDCHPPSHPGLKLFVLLELVPM